MNNGKKTLVLVDPTVEQASRAQEALPGDWEADVVSADEILGGKAEDTGARADACVVFSRTHEEDEALSLCQSIRNASAFEDVQLLVAITIYQMILGNEVKKLPKSDFVFTPIDGKQLRERLEKVP